MAAINGSEKMRVMPVGKLLFTMAIPAMLSMFVKALYNIVDSIYISHYSASGLEALSIVFPLQTIVIALAIAISVGTNALVARKLGERNLEEANQLAGNGLLIAFGGLVFIIILATFLPEIFMTWFTDDAQTIADGTIYLKVVMYFSVGTFIEMCLCRILQATGNMRIPMISQIMGAVINIILDQIFIFGFWFIPSMGVLGAAIATVIGQIIAMIFVILYYIFKKQEITIAWRYFKPHKQHILNILRLALPTFVMNSINSVTTTIMNLILKAYPYAITIHGVYFKIRSFIFMPVFGMTQGLTPILSYNYGANLKERFKRAHLIATISSVSILTIGALLFLIIPGTLLSIFNIEGEALKVGIYSLRVLALSFFGSSLCIIASTTLQSLGNGISSLLITLFRQIILAVPCAFLFSYLFGFEGVFFCYLVAETLVAVISYPLEIVVARKKFKAKELLTQTN